MILQLKITLKDFKPPIWRRIELRDTMTFYDLHRVIQIAFDWEDYHLHGFEIRKSNAVQVNYTVGSVEEDLYSFTDNDYDENELLLKNVFLKEKDRVLYTYDYGDDWEHEIVVEKIFPEEAGVSYPRCTKVMREAPGEDSRFHYIELGHQTNEVISKEEVEYINGAFSAILSNEDTPSIEAKTIVSENSSWDKLLDVVDEYKQLQPWNWLDDDQIFAVQDPVTKEYVYCSILGGAGQEYGLAAFIGDEGLQYLNRIISNSNIDPSYHITQRSLFLSLCDRGELSNEDYQLLKELGKTYRGKNQWPLFRSFSPGYYPWFLAPEEVQLFTLVLEQVNQVCALVRRNPNLLIKEQNRYFGRVFNEQTGNWENIEVISQGSFKQENHVPLKVNELELQQLKSGLKRANLALEFDCDYLLSPSQDSPDERPYYPTMVLCIERKNGMIIFHDIIKEKRNTEIIQNSVLNLIKQLESIPREIWVKEEVANYIKPLAKKLNIQLMVVKNLPLIGQVQKEMETMMF